MPHNPLETIPTPRLIGELIRREVIERISFNAIVRDADLTMRGPKYRAYLIDSMWQELGAGLGKVLTVAEGPTPLDKHATEFRAEVFVVKDLALAPAKGETDAPAAT